MAKPGRGGHRNLQSFIHALRAEGELVDVQVSADPRGVIPEIQRRVVAEQGPALLFHRPSSGRFPLVCNLFGNQKRIEIAFGQKPEQLVRDLVEVVDQLPPKPSDVWHRRKLIGQMLRLGLKSRSRGPVTQQRTDSLNDLPVLTCWPLDGGPFITLPLVYTEHPHSGKGNLGMYRLQVQAPQQTGMHIQIHRGGGNHYYQAESQGQALPCCVFLGGPPALILAAIAPLPEDVPELVFASLVQGHKLDMIKNQRLSPLPLVGEADFCLVGEIPPHVRAPEGPFGDHYGYYSLQHDYPVFQIRHILHRPDAIYPATVVGRPPQEDHFLALYLQKLLSPIFPLVLKGVKDVFAFEESGVHSLAGAVVHERYPKEAFTAAMRILGEGQLSLTKVLLVTDGDVNPRHFKDFLCHILARWAPETDLHVISHISMDTLDYTGPAVNSGSKAVFLGLGDVKFALEDRVPDLSKQSEFGAAHLFCPGVLVVKGPAYQADDGAAERLQRLAELKAYRWVVLHDEPEEAVRSEAAFLWHVFTRFEPAGDLYGQQTLVRNHVTFSGPLVLDCRLKPGYPDVLQPDPEVVLAVDRLWPQLGLDRV
ncbi:MAG: UbiD family decarboxylase [Acidobacteria bacterium]|nr:UbiD family decarboxylase [Acidobacteriota bacterium]MCB9398525.1 UbiD family decarboxylase [Acidobacteriota bacterium]